MRSCGLTGREIARQIGRSKTVVYKKLNLNFSPNWTEEEKQKVIDMRAKGKPYRKIAKHICRSEAAARIFMCRHRKAVISDPRKRQVLRFLMLAFKHTKDPGKALVAIRKSNLLGRYDDVLQL